MRKLIIISILIATFSNCMHRNVMAKQTELSTNEFVDSNCLILKKVISSYHNDNNNAILNELLPLIESATGIQSRATKGYIGYWYYNDSSFRIDCKKWCEFLHCKDCAP